MHRPSTIANVAARAGVSTTTVSHVLSGRRPVAAATRAKVLRIVAELGYRPNPNAQALVTSSSRTIALIVPDITNPFYATVARGLQDATIKSGYQAFVADSRSMADREIELLRDAVHRRVDGVAIAAFGVGAPEIEALGDLGIPVIAINPGLADANVDIVAADDRRMGYDAVRLLIGKGHTRIAFIGGLDESPTGRLRLAGYHDALREAGLEGPAELTVDGGWTRDGGHLAMQRLLELPDRPTAVYAANDLMAIGVIDAAREMSLTLPRDLAVVGTDDIDAASLVVPRLTTVRTPGIEIGRRVGELLLDRIATDRDRPTQTVLIRHEVVERDSA